VANQRLEYFVEPVFVIHPIYFPHHRLDRCPAPGCSGNKVDKKGFTDTGVVTTYGLNSNYKSIGQRFVCSGKDHPAWCGTSSYFWESRHEEIFLHNDVPHFQYQVAVTRELYDFVTEMRPQSTIGGMTESIKQLHLLHNERRKLEYSRGVARSGGLAQFFTPKPLPDSLEHHFTGGGSKKEPLEINPSPSETIIRDVYECFAKFQRVPEATRYLKTLTGTVLGVDATLKIANKANVYSTEKDAKGKTKVVTENLWKGGLLTAVNEDNELVGFEFMLTNSPLEMGESLQEYAQRSKELGVNFIDNGEIVCDRCCDFRSSVKVTLGSKVTVVQDLAHINNRILRAIPQTMGGYRTEISKGVKNAILSVVGNRKGTVSQYRRKEDQLARFDKIRAQFCNVPNLWSTELEVVWLNQRKHIDSGCLQRRHPDKGGHTSSNETFHKLLADPFRGHPSSLVTVNYILHDQALRLNMRRVIHHRSQPADTESRRFREYCKGSHHLLLVSHNIEQARTLFRQANLPRFLDLAPTHRFGVVGRDPKFNGVESDHLQTLAAKLVKGTLKPEEDEEILIFDFGVTMNGDEDLPMDLDAILPPPSHAPQKRIRELEEEDCEIEFIESKKSRHHGSMPSSSLVNGMDKGKGREIVDLTSSPERETPVATRPLPSRPLAPIFTQTKRIGSSSGVSATSSSSSSTSSAPSSSPTSSSATTSSSPVSSSSSQSRTQQAFSDGYQQISWNQVAAREKFGGNAYYRFAAFRLLHHVHRGMTDKDLVRVLVDYNNQHYPIPQQYYNAQRALPLDPIQRSLSAFRNFTSEFDKQIQGWLAKKLRGE
ncbi:hypothetical protein JCM5350_006645, partial [Sporobolomyces pararoseus]